MNLKRLSLPFIALTVLSVFALSASAANATTNSDFETGDLTGWEVYTTPNGTGSSPVVDLVDITGLGVITNAVKLSVGQVVDNDGGCGSDADCRNGVPEIFEGAGVRQSFTVTNDGDVAAVSASVAVMTPAGADAETGGFFELLIDGDVVDSALFEAVAGGSTVGLTLESNVTLSAGTHEVAVQATRPWTTLGMNSTSPNQFIDEIVVDVTAPPPTPVPTPEPTATPEPEPTATPEPEPTATPEPEPTATPEPEPTATPKPKPTETPKPEPTATPKPTETPKPEPTPEPTVISAPDDPDDDDDDRDEEPVNRFAALIEIIIEWLYKMLRAWAGR